MKYRVTQPFIAFGMTTEPGQVVELTPEQAKVLTEMEAVSPYETKVKPKPENKRKGKSSGSSRPAQVSKKVTRKRSSKKQTK